MKNFKALIFLIIGIYLIIGCETVQPAMTAKEKIVYYGCYYCKSQSGFCCNKEVPFVDLYIFNCENAVLFTEE